MSLNSWGRGICHWAQELTSLAELRGQKWPANLRVCFIPSRVSLSGLTNLRIAAITPFPEKECGIFGRVPTTGFRELGRGDNYCCRKRLKASLKLLGHLHQAEAWEEKLLGQWPSVYQSASWWEQSLHGDHG